MIFSHFSGKAIRAAGMGGSFADCPIDLSRESLHFDPSPHIIDAVERSLRTPEPLELSKGRLGEKLKGERGSLLFTHGVRGALTLALMAYLNPNDEVLVFAPGIHGGLPLLLGASVKTLVLDEEEGFFPDLDAVKAALSARTRMIIFSNPQKPTGVLWDEETLKGLSALARERNIFLLADESAASFVYEGPFTSLGRWGFDNAAIVRDITLGFAPGGWDMAALQGSPDFIARAEAVQALCQGALNGTALQALSEVWELLPAHNALLLEELRERRNLLLKILASQHGLRITRPSAGLSCFPTMRYYLGNEVGGRVPSNSQEFSSILADRAGVYVEPGSAYGLEGFFKCSFTLPAEALAEAGRKIAALLDRR